MTPTGPVPADFDGTLRPSYSWTATQSFRERYWLHAVLLAVTFLTTTAMGARMALNFAGNLPAMSDDDLDSLFRLWRDPALLWQGVPFSAALLGTLLAHEFGHYLACVFYRVNASLPYFLPAPTLIGTFGAFIRIRSPILSRLVLFDVGVAGPLAGFLFLLPTFAIGLAYSKVIPGIGTEGDLIFGIPLLERALAAAIFPGVSPEDIYLHPIARAAWVGALATALNLLPIGQLDGGHILYSFFSRAHRWLSRAFVAALVPLGLVYSWSWILWAVFLFLFAMRHPVIHDRSRLRAGRVALGILALLVFILCFTVTPVRLGPSTP